MNRWLYLPLFVPCTFSFSILLNGKRSQLPSMVGMGVLAFVSSWVLSLEPSLNSINAFLSAMTVGCAGNAYANLSGRPGMPATASGVFILVPGAMALRSLSSMFANAFLGMQLTGGWLAVTVQIGAGVFLSSLIISPREISIAQRWAMRRAGKPSAMHSGKKRRAAPPTSCHPPPLPSCCGVRGES